MEQIDDLTNISNISNINIFEAKNCTPNNNSGNYIIYSLIHITGLFIIISSVYLLYSKKLTEKYVNDGLNTIVNNAINKKINNFDLPTRTIIQEQLKNIQLEQIKKIYAKPDDEYVTNNKWVVHGIYAIIITFIIIILIASLISKQYCSKIHFADILKENVVIFFFIGLIEFMFFYYAILHYIPYSPSYVNNLFISHINQL